MSAPTELLRKLQIIAGSKIWMINVPQAIAEEISAGAEVEPVHEKDAYDGVLAFFTSASEVESVVPRILAELPSDGLLWVAYPKGETGKDAGISRDTGWSPLESAGWRPVRQVAIDAQWSALRFRPRTLVKAQEGSRFA